MDDLSLGKISSADATDTLLRHWNEKLKNVEKETKKVFNDIEKIKKQKKTKKKRISKYVCESMEGSDAKDN